MALAILLAFTIVRTYFYLGNFDIQLSRTTYDAGPVAIGHYMHSPQNFVNDIELNLSYRQWLPSLLFWLTVVLDLLLKVKPESSALIFVYCQHLFLVGSIFYLAMAVSKNVWVAVCSALYVMWFTPQFFNLSYYGELLWMPYAGHLALPFFICSFALLIKDRWRWALASLFIGGLIHLVLGVQVACMTAVYFALRQYMGDKVFPWQRPFDKKYVWLASILLCFMALPKIFVLGIKPIDPKEAYSLVAGVVHQVPWLAGWEPFFEKVLALLTKFVLASLTLLACKRYFSKETFLVWSAIVLSTILFCFSNWFATVIKSSLLLQVSGFRSSTFVILFSIPLLFSAFYPVVWPSVVTKKSKPLLLVVLLAGAIWTYLKLGEGLVWNDAMKLLSALTGVLLICMLLFKRSGTWFLVPLPGSIIFIAVMTIFKAASYFWPHIHFSNLNGIFLSASAIIVVFIYFIFSGSDRFRPMIATIAILALALNSMADGVEYGRETTTGTWAKIYEAQVWARDHTPEGSHFILMDLLSPFQSWRTLTRRGVVTQAMPYGNQYFYSQDMVDYTTRLNAFYERPNPAHYFVFDKNNENIVRLEMYEAFQKLDESKLIKFSKTFGGDYIVRKTSERKLNFPVAYQNDYVTIYAIDKN
jgi:hypothetical protein